MSLIEDLTGQRDKLVADAQALVNQLNTAQQGYSIDHFGGQTPSQFAAYIAPIESSLSGFTDQITSLTQQIANLKDPAAAAAGASTIIAGASAPNLPSSPISTPPLVAAPSAGIPGPQGPAGQSITSPIYIPTPSGSSFDFSPLLSPVAFVVGAVLAYFLFVKK